MTLLIQLPKGSQSTEGVTDTTLATGEGTKISITPGLDTDGIYIGLALLIFGVQKQVRFHQACISCS